MPLHFRALGVTMLNKNICLKCLFRKISIWDDEATEEYFEPRWKKGMVMCPSPEGFYEWKITDEPPPICDYALEQVVNKHVE